MKILVYRLVLLSLSLLAAGNAYAISPRLNFTDLISGPDVGLGDGLGSGVIVTVWGQNLGSSQGGSTVTFIDANGVKQNAAHVYYWKDADGTLPGGPANLFVSHKMQEIAFSIPDSATGAGQIQVTVNGAVSNTLPFTVRSGNIYHVKASGSDTSGKGTFASPWKSVNKAENAISTPGATLYVHDSVVDGNSGTTRAIYWNNAPASSGLANQYAFVAYPGSQPSAVGESGFLNFNTKGQVVSKYKIFASNCKEGANGQPTGCTSQKTYAIQTTAFGRAVGNAITDQVGGCASATQGAISGNALDGDRISGYQIFGNEVYDYGCYGSNKLHHTTYMSIRSGTSGTPNLQVPAWRFGWNYLHDNHTKNGIHNYDERADCGTPVGTLVINDNVVVNQAGAGITVASACGWTNDWDVYNNIVINAGLAVDWNGVDVTTSNGPNTAAISFQDDGLIGVVNVYNNTFIGWNNDDLARSSQACIGLEGEANNLILNWSNNICSTSKDKFFVNTGFQAAGLIDNPTGSNNIWHYSGSSPKNAIAPSWDSAKILASPLLGVQNQAFVTVGLGSPAIDASNNPNNTHDIYGVERLPGGDIGAVENLNRPKSPSNLIIKKVN